MVRDRVGVRIRRYISDRVWVYSFGLGLGTWLRLRLDGTLAVFTIAAPRYK